MIVDPYPKALDKAIDILISGGLLGLPTETVYGLAADASQDLAVAQIFERKKRPTLNPLIVHGASQESFQEHVVWNEKAEALARAFWPGALTLVLPRLQTSTLSLLVSAGLETLAVRVPSHPVCQELLYSFGKLVAAPSANPSGRLSPTQAYHVEEDFPDLFILEGGNAKLGIESTILDLTGPFPVLLRPGGIPKENLERVIGVVETFHSSSTIKAPGMMKSHYAPQLPLRLNATQPFDGEAYLAFGPVVCEGEIILNLSPRGDLTEAAAQLFKMLRELDKPHFKGIAVASLPNEGLGCALNDRLERAAAPREL